jgi:DNA modification methylase
MELNQLYNLDCMEGMKEMPDNYIDLAVVDPPYGDAMGRAEYNGAVVGRFGGTFAKYYENKNGGGYVDKAQAFTISADGLTDTISTRPKNPKIAWGELEEHGRQNTARKSSIGMLLRRASILKNCSECLRIRLYGAVITLNFHLHGVS